MCVCRNGSEYKNRMIRASTCGALLCGGKMHTKYVQIVALCCGVAGRVRVPWTNSLLLLEFTNVQIHFLARSVRRFHLSMFADSDGIFFFAVVAQSARSVVGFMSRFLFSLCVCGRRRRFAGDYIWRQTFMEILCYSAERKSNRKYIVPQRRIRYTSEILY